MYVLIQYMGERRNTRKDQKLDQSHIESASEKTYVTIVCNHCYVTIGCRCLINKCTPINISTKLTAERKINSIFATALEM